MAKRGRGERGYSDSPRRHGDFYQNRNNSSQSSRPWEERQPPQKKQRLTANTGPKPPPQNVQQILRGSPEITASLLIQLVAELDKDAATRNELEALIGGKAIADLQRLQNSLSLVEPHVKNVLHREPRLPHGAQPMAHFPSSLSAALVSSRVTAHPHTVPPLPPIKDPETARLPWIHRSKHNDHHRAVTASYERIELLGDAYIEAMATRLVYASYPDLAVGRLSQLREKLVCNETLSAYAMAYDFAERVRVPETYLEEGADRSKIWTKLLGDVFEAYVAGIILADPKEGFDIAEKWMQRLWAPLLPNAEDTREPDKNAKQDLQRKLGGVAMRLSYEQTGELVPFKGGNYWPMTVFLTGWGFEHEALGTYRGRSKQVAELGAAEAALANPLTGQVQAIKVKYDEKVRKEREEAAEMLAQEKEAPELLEVGNRANKFEPKVHKGEGTKAEAAERGTSS